MGVYCTLGVKVRFQSQDLLKQLECVGSKPALVAYQDGAGIWTIGVGHTRNVHAGLTCTEAQADQWLDDDLRGIEQAIATCVKITLTQSQYDALVIWDFNTGALLSSKRLLTLINNGKFSEASTLMQRYNHIHADGKLVVSPGLTNRRTAEAALWNAQPAPATPAVATVPASGEVPVPPPETVSQTTTGKLQIGALATSIAAVVTQGVTSVQPVIDAGHTVIAATDGLEGVVKVAGIVLMVFSIAFAAVTLWHKSDTLKGKV